MVEEVNHYQINQRYKVQFERSAVKGVDGFKVEANGDDMDGTMADAVKLYGKAIRASTPILSTTSDTIEIKEKPH